MSLHFWIGARIDCQALVLLRLEPWYLCNLWFWTQISCQDLFLRHLETLHLCNLWIWARINCQDRFLLHLEIWHLCTLWIWARVNCQDLFLLHLEAWHLCNFWDLSSSHLQDLFLLHLETRNFCSLWIWAQINCCCNILQPFSWRHFCDACVVLHNTMTQQGIRSFLIDIDLAAFYLRIQWLPVLTTQGGYCLMPILSKAHRWVKFLRPGWRLQKAKMLRQPTQEFISVYSQDFYGIYCSFYDAGLGIQAPFLTTMDNLYLLTWAALASGQALSTKQHEPRPGTSGPDADAASLWPIFMAHFAQTTQA